MAKTKSANHFQCSNCGNQTTKWEGKCSQCGEWNTLEETIVIDSSSPTGGKALITHKFATLSSTAQTRFSSGHKELDDLLGGGFVVGSVLLIAGEPGIGKSTLLMQVAGLIAKTKTVLYVSAEESVSQVGIRAKRLGIESSSQIELVDSNSCEDVAATIESGKYQLAIVDSIQTLQSSRSSTVAGSVTQVTAVGQLLSRAAKKTDTVLILVGHVTKEGNIAGPKVLEHLVDVVLNLEGDRFSTLRLLRSQKNRYGPTDELVLFDMHDNGLVVVNSPSQELLRERQVSDGSVVLGALDGNRALLVEVQALVSPTSFGYPRRTAVGFELNRLNLLLAMLSKRTKLDLSSSDVYLSIVGGFKLNDPGADLGVCMAIASAATGMKLKDDAVVFGEVGLGGELRHVMGAEKRIKEANSLKFKRVIGPASVKTKQSIYQGLQTVREVLNSTLKKG